MQRRDAAACAHGRRVLHRALGPENTMFGRFLEVFVMDWGVTRVGYVAQHSGETKPNSVRDSGEAHLTRAGAILGIPSTVSPEQARRSRRGGRVERCRRARRDPE